MTTTVSMVTISVFRLSAFEFDPELSKIGDTITAVETMQRPRFVKTHLPVSLLPAQLLTKKPKVSDW